MSSTELRTFGGLLTVICIMLAIAYFAGWDLPQ